MDEGRDEMVCPNDAEVRDRLEMLYCESPSISLFTRFREFFGQIATAIAAELTRDRSAPRVSKFYTFEGKAFWHVYAPQIGERCTFYSELEVREWLDSHYSDPLDNNQK
jgi:hypothetical protein